MCDHGVLYAVRQWVISPSQILPQEFLAKEKRWVKSSKGFTKQTLYFLLLNTARKGWSLVLAHIFGMSVIYPLLWGSITRTMNWSHISEADETVVMALGKHAVFLFRTPLSVNLPHF